MLFKRITSILRINGGEIFQQETVDKVHQENRRRGSRAHRRLVAYGWNEKALTTNVMTEIFGKRGLRPQSPNHSDVAISCDLDTEPGLRKSGSKGRDLERENAPFAFS